MMHSLPTTSAKKQRDRRIIAIVMAIMLHILIAGIVYFTVFDKNPSATLAPISVDDKHSILTTTQIQQQTSLALAENTDIAAKPGRNLLRQKVIIMSPTLIKQPRLGHQINRKNQR